MRSFRLSRFLATLALVATVAASTMLSAGVNTAPAGSSAVAAPVEFEGPGGCAPIPLC
jgi:hypothetical protein